MTIKPIAIKIDQKTKKISYICNFCACSFELLGKNAKYCYNCGNQIEWDNLPICVPNDFKDVNLKDYVKHQEILNFINSKYLK